LGTAPFASGCFPHAHALSEVQQASNFGQGHGFIFDPFAGALEHPNAELQYASYARWMNSILYPSGSSTNAITLPPNFIGPGSRVTLPPFAFTASHVL
jgi:hypothetical protein